MKIFSITIKNYRSIKKQVVIDISKVGTSSCSILLGINESGKSNILKAVSLLDETEAIDYETDCNYEAQDEDEPILIKFNTNIENITSFREQAIEAGVPENLGLLISVKDIDKEISVEKNESRTDSYKLVLDEIPTEFLDKYIITDGVISERSEANEVNDTAGKIINLLNKSKLEALLESELKEYLDGNIPAVVFWEMSEKNLISAQVDLNSFKSNRNVSIPLKNSFKISGYETLSEVTSAIETIVTNPSKSSTLMQKLSESVTEHINSVWKGHNVSVKFHIDNMQLTFLVEDNDSNIPKYQVKQRSDGFKHFISILLNLSAENKTNDLKNKIVILDEPETHLHPTGEKYLRDELLNIGKNNFVIFATHSIFMVDTKNIERHYSVSKNDGISTVVKIEADNPFQEDVLYEALGTSVLEVVEPNVLLLEGKTDRDIFELYKRKFKREIKSPKISTISADGCNNVIKYTKFFNRETVKGYVILDSDTEGEAQKNEIIKCDGYNTKNTFTINDILKTKDGAELEDLFDSKYLENPLKEVFGLDIVLSDQDSYMNQIKDILKTSHKPFRDQQKEKLKQSFFEQIKKIKKEDLKSQKYYSFFEKLSKKIKT